MVQKRISIFDSVTYALRNSLDHFKFFFIAYIKIIALTIAALIFAALLILALGAPALKHYSHFAQKSQLLYYSLLFLGQAGIKTIFVIALLFVLFLHLLYYNYTKLMLRFYDKGEQADTSLFHGFDTFLSFLGASFLFCVVVLVGLCLGVFPGIYLSMRLGFYSYLVVDKHLGAIDSLKQSFAITQGHVWDVFVLYMGFMLTGFEIVALPLSFFFVQPLLSLTYVDVYRKLVASSSK